MASNVTLLQLRNRARQRANMEGSQFVTDAEINQLINTSIPELYDLLVSANSEYYLSSQTLTFIPGTDTYSLPGDFYKLLGVDGILDPSGNAVTLRPFNFQERNNALYTTATSGSILTFRYRLQGKRSVSFPYRQSAMNLKLWYIPVPTALVLDTDTFDGINGWEEYVVVDCAIKMLIKEESPVTEIMAEKQGNGSTPERDGRRAGFGTPERVTDVTRTSPWDLLNGWENG